MADREPAYDPYIPSGQSGSGSAGARDGNQRTAALQAVGTFSWILRPGTRTARSWM